MKFFRQRISGVLILLGLLLSWVGLTSLVVRQTLFVPGRIPGYAISALHNSQVRSAVAEFIAGSAQAQNPQLAAIPKASLSAAVDSALTDPAVSAQFANAALQIQEHMIGLQQGPITVGGPVLSSIVAKALAGNNATEEQILAKIPFTYTISPSSIPSFANLYRKIAEIINLSLISAATLLLLAVSISAKKGKTVRRIGIGFIALSAVEVLLLYLAPKYLISHIHSGPLLIVVTLMSVTTATAGAIYLTALALGAILLLGSFIL